MKAIGRSLNPSEHQLELIKCEVLRRRFKRTGQTPAMLFYKKDLHAWLKDNSRMSVYKRFAKYGNNFSI